MLNLLSTDLNSPSQSSSPQQYMTAYDRYRLTHIFKLLGTRIIPAYFFNQNPMEFCKWQFNACRQTALLTAYFLNELLKSFKHSSVDIRIWDGEFRDKFTPWYNHAWVTASPPNAPGQIFLDLARITTYPIIDWCTYLDLPEAVSVALSECGTKTLKMVPLDYQEMLKKPEFYTGKTGLEVCKDVEKMMLMYSYDLSEFKWGEAAKTVIDNQLAPEEIPF